MFKKIILSLFLALFIFSSVGIAVGCSVLMNTSEGMIPTWVDPCPYPTINVSGVIIPSNEAPVITEIAVYSDAGLTNRIDVATMINGIPSRLVEVQYFMNQIISDDFAFTTCEPEFDQLWLKVTAIDSEGDEIFYSWVEYSRYTILPENPPSNEQELVGTSFLDADVISESDTAVENLPFYLDMFFEDKRVFYHSLIYPETTTEAQRDDFVGGIASATLEIRHLKPIEGTITVINSDFGVIPIEEINIDDTEIIFPEVIVENDGSPIVYPDEPAPDLDVIPVEEAETTEETVDETILIGGELIEIEETNPEIVVIPSSSSGSVTIPSSYSPSIQKNVPLVNTIVEVELADIEIIEQEIVSEPVEIEITVSSFERNSAEPVIGTQKITELKTLFLEVVKKVRMLLVGL